MNKKIIIVIAVVIIVAVVYLVNFVHGYVKYSHSVQFNGNSCLWIFTDFNKDKVDTSTCFSAIRAQDTYTHFFFKRDYSVGIWELNEYKNNSLNEIQINERQYLKDVSFTGETFKGNPEISIRSGDFFSNSFNVNLDFLSEVKNKINGVNYKGFYGTINRMSFSNNDGEHLVLWDFRQPQNGLVVLFKKNTHFYVIVIYSEKPFDESIIKILNLE